ncbi:hypothetical protein JK214_15235, partial [Lactiplantibacillus plantarum]|nr:hypothetical protein [Lactiplantibacillus plantarum]
VNDTASNVVISLSTKTIGYSSNATQLVITITTTNPLAEETYAVNLPATTAVIGSYSSQDLSSAGGTSTLVKNTDGSYTLTGTFNTSTNGVVTQTVTANLLNNYWAQSSPMQEIGTTIKTISYSVNGVAQTPVTFDQVIEPGLNSSFGTTVRTKTETSSGILPNVNYIYQFNVGEYNGVADNTSASAVINSAANYGGTKITIPVPSGFILNSELTSKLNTGSLTGTTITQPNGEGGDIIITAVAGAGMQGWQVSSPYAIAGYYAVAQTSAEQTLSATSGASFTQVLNSTGDTLTFTSTKVWSDTLLAADADVDYTGTVTLKGNSGSASTQITLNSDTKPDYLNSFTVSNTSVQSSTDAHIVLVIPDGFDVTGISTPDSVTNSSTYMDSTTSYSYVITLADGTVESGTVKAGDTIEPTDKSAIRKAVITPDLLVAGANSGEFKVLGTLSSTYDNGDAVEIGAKLSTSVSLNFANSANPADPDVKPVSSQSVVQTVEEAFTNVYAYVVQNSKVPGQTNAGFLSLSTLGNRPYTTKYIYEPIFYYVIPSATSVYSVSNVGDAKVSYSKTDDGHTLVIIDYTGTGTSVDLSSGSGFVNVALSNNADALLGSYQYYMYVYSPKTALGTANQTKPSDLSYVNNNENAFLIYSDNWWIDAAGVFKDYSYAQGNKDASPVAAATSDSHGDSTATFYTNIVNTSTSTSKAIEVINLPTIGDSQGSSYNFQLTGPITVPSNYLTSSGTGNTIDATVLYSTSLGNMDANSTSPDESGYMSADKVTDWSAIRSVIILLNSVQSNTATGRIELSGTIADFKSQASHVGYLQTALYIGTSKPSISTTASEAKLSIVGQATVYARLHYVKDGVDEYVDLTDLNQTLNENVDILSNIYPTTKSGFSATDQALFPTGYNLVANSMHIVDSNDDGVPVIGDVASYYYDGDYVQYELVGNSNLNIKYVDDDDNGSQVGSTTTFNGPSGESNTYTVVVPNGYKLASTQDVEISDNIISFTLVEGDTSLNIHLVHDSKISNMTTTDTVNYSGLPEAKAQTSVSKPVSWTINTDDVTGVTTYTPDDTDKTVTVKSP